jgi:hypothetical protein
MWGTLISSVFGIGQSWLQNKAEKQKAVHEKDITVIKNSATWEEKQADNSNASWKDEWFTIVLSVPLIGAFIPELVPFIAEGFMVLETMPDYYKGFLGAAMAASFGIKGLAKWGNKG